MIRGLFSSYVLDLSAREAWGGPFTVAADVKLLHAWKTGDDVTIDFHLNACMSSQHLIKEINQK